MRWFSKVAAIGLVLVSTVSVVALVGDGWKNLSPETYSPVYYWTQSALGEIGHEFAKKPGQTTPGYIRELCGLASQFVVLLGVVVAAIVGWRRKKRGQPGPIKEEEKMAEAPFSLPKGWEIIAESNEPVLDRDGNIMAYLHRVTVNAKMPIDDEEEEPEKYPESPPPAPKDPSKVYEALCRAITALDAEGKIRVAKEGTGMLWSVAVGKTMARLTIDTEKTDSRIEKLLDASGENLLDKMEPGEVEDITARLVGVISVWQWNQKRLAENRAAANILADVVAKPRSEDCGNGLIATGGNSPGVYITPIDASSLAGDVYVHNDHLVAGAGSGSGSGEASVETPWWKDMETAVQLGISFGDVNAKRRRVGLSNVDYNEYAAAMKKVNGQKIPD